VTADPARIAVSIVPDLKKALRWVGATGKLPGGYSAKRRHSISALLPC
jgi:hypothetical protein